MTEDQKRRGAVVTLPETTHALVDQLVDSGLFGNNADECLERLVSRTLEELIATGFVRVDPAEPQPPAKLPDELADDEGEELRTANLGSGARPPAERRAP